MVRVERSGPVTTVILDRPEVRNAVDRETAQALADAFRAFDADDEQAVAVLLGAGGTFCAGADLKAMSQPSSDPRVQERAAQITDYHWKGLLRAGRPTKPLICAIEGYAVAGGTELLAGTDLRVVAEGATLGLFEAKRGLFPMGGSAVRLPRQIGYAAALDILLTARSVTPQEALAMGLINKIVPAGQALAAARETADQIAACAPLSVQAILRAVRETEHLSEEDALKISDEIGWPVFASEDAKEGSKAFKEKRPPTYQGK
jgi:enoyl-CoA hydratase